MPTGSGGFTSECVSEAEDKGFMKLGEPESPWFCVFGSEKDAFREPGGWARILFSALILDVDELKRSGE